MYSSPHRLQILVLVHVSELQGALSKEGLDGGGGYKCQLSVKILTICQLSVKCLLGQTFCYVLGSCFLSYDS